MPKTLETISKEIFQINNDEVNKTGKIFLNDLKNEFILLNGLIEIPKIFVGGLTDLQKIELTEIFIQYIPEFLKDHSLMIAPKPFVDNLSIHFAKQIKGKLFNYIHYFKIDLKFGGNPSTIIDKGGTDYYPSYKTDRLYYKSFLIPVENVKIEQDMIIDFESARVFSEIEITSDEQFHTFVLFQDINLNEKNDHILKKLNVSIFPFSSNIYQFVAYGFFSVVFNVPKPDKSELLRAADIFEPILIKLYSDFNPEKFSEIKNMIINKNDSSLIDDLVFNENSIILSGTFEEKASFYFSRYSIFRDDALALKRWRRFDIKKPIL